MLNCIITAEVAAKVVARDTGLGEGRGRGLRDGAVGVSHHHECVKPKSSIHAELRVRGKKKIGLSYTHLLSVKCKVQTCHIAVDSPSHAPCT